LSRALLSIKLLILALALAICFSTTSFHGKEGALHSFTRSCLFGVVLCSSKVITFGVNIKQVGGVKNTLPSTPPTEALLTFVGGFVEPNYIPSIMTSETFIVGVFSIF